MFAFNAFGSDHEIGLTIAGNTAAWISRTFSVYAPAPAGLAGKDGTRLIPDWKRELAGLSSLVLDIDRTTDAPSLLGWDTFPVVAPALSAALKACAIVATKDNPRNYGSVVAFQGALAVATDGFRLTWISSGFSTVDTLCLPVGTVKPLLAFLKKAGDDVSGFLSDDRTSLCIRAGNGATFHARLSAVKYPNWNSVAPKRFGATIPADDVARIREEVAAKKKASKKSETIHVEIGGHTFNARFVADLPDGCSIRLGENEEEPCLAEAGGVSMVLCPIKRPEEEKNRGTSVA